VELREREIRRVPHSFALFADEWEPETGRTIH
jgi:hypothetical protein